MGWDVKQPKTLLSSSDRSWPAGIWAKKVQQGDVICVYMKNIGPNPDGVYVVGEIKKVGLRDGHFAWGVDRLRSAKVVVSPVGKAAIQRFFPRIYGGSMQPLPEKRRDKWLSLLGRGHKVFRDTPIINVRRANKPTSSPKTPRDPLISRENGLKGERHVLASLKQEFPSSAGYRIEHVASKNFGSDHDISIFKNGRMVQLVEVKTRVGRPNDPVIISEREISCRNRNPGRHTIYVVYLDNSGAIHSTLRIGRSDAFRLGPRQHWLHPQAP